MTPALGIILRGGFDPDARRFFTAAGITVSQQKIAVNQLTKSLKAAGLWASIFALYPFVGGTAAAHAQNLISASFPITWVNGPTHNANGVTGNGTTQYGQCVGLAGNTVIPHLHGQTIYLRTSTATSTGTVSRYCGFTDGGFLVVYTLEYNDTGGSEANRACMGAAANYMTEASVVQRIGCLSINRTATNAVRAYQSAVQYLVNTTNDASVPPAQDCYIMALNFGGAAASFTPGNFALYAVHAPFSATQVATFTNIIEAYQDALGRGIA